MFGWRPGRWSCGVVRWPPFVGAGFLRGGPWQDEEDHQREKGYSPKGCGSPAVGHLPILGGGEARGS